MIVVYRATPALFAGDLSGEGARLYGGRWNERGVPALYTASSVALALLENLVHIGDKADFPVSYTITEIEVDGELQTMAEVPPERATSQRLGTGLLADPTCLGFWTPSVVVAHERNLVLNPRCRDFAQRVLVRQTFLQPVDQRLNR